MQLVLRNGSSWAVARASASAEWASRRSMPNASQQCCSLAAPMVRPAHVAELRRIDHVSGPDPVNVGCPHITPRVDQRAPLMLDLTMVVGEHDPTSTTRSVRSGISPVVSKSITA